jgi:hypothetical protein
MRAIKFPESNRNLVKPQGWTDEQCLSLDVYRERTDIGDVWISRWQGTWLDRLRFLFTGKLWLKVYSYAHPPVYVGTEDAFTRPEWWRKWPWLAGQIDRARLKRAFLRAEESL